MARLPHRETADGLDAAFVGVPIDTGTSNRPGARSGYKVGLILRQSFALSALPCNLSKNDISADIFIEVVSEKLVGVTVSFKPRLKEFWV